jgi:hypothetical protein
MQTIGVVAPPANTAASVYWGVLLAADSNYDDDLPYHYNPSAPSSYNSNGYTHGIINATAGTLTVPIPSGYIGWNDVVPPSAFGE